MTDQHKPMAAVAFSPSGMMRLIGYVGLVPFIGLGVMVLLGEGEFASRAALAMVTYGAVIFSFIGGLHWGLVLLHSQGSVGRLSIIALGIGPSLLAWLAILVSLKLALVLLVMGFAALLGLDFAAHRSGRVPSWFLSTRIVLTCVVIACLLVLFSL